MELKEKLRVKNFIVLKDVEIDIGRFNIVVGPQSSGKSLLAKLVHFFKGAGRDMSNGIVSEIDFDRIRVALRGKFIDRFGFGSKSTEEYLIRYEFLGEYIEIRGRGSFVKFEFSQGFTGKYKEVIREYNEGIEAHRLSFPEDFLSFADKREMLQ
ncbi:AAA family ATPase, partial [Chromobacterium piscinae]|uniref:AAA family ATPase n=1 Tax=Chromobacterium piscinae TaxID=686831 RepID=UPI0032083220